MQSVGTILWDMKADRFRTFLTIGFVPIIILSAVAITILPALASEPQPAGRSANGGAVAVASARVVNPFKMTSSAAASTRSDDNAIMVSRRTTLRKCALLLGVDANQGPAATCELRLTELQ
jgi:hypothetical protein